MTLRLRFGMAGAVVVLLLVALGLIIPRVVTTSQITQVDQQLTEALPRAARPREGSGALEPSEQRQAHASGGECHRTVQQHLHRRDQREDPTVLVALGSGDDAPALPTRHQLGSELTAKFRDRHFGEGSGAWRALLVRHADGQEVLIAASLQSLDATDAQLRLALLVGGGVLVLIGAALWWWLVRLGLNPIADVTSVADAITAGDRSRRVGEPPAGSEAAHLARAINVMLDEEQAVEDHLRRFIADASHELRTPLTVIQGVAELWREGRARRQRGDRRRAPPCRPREHAHGGARRGPASPRPP